MQAAIDRRATRIIAVLALALGVLAMHGLAGSHHAGAAAVPAAVAAAAAEHGADAAYAAAHTGHELHAAAAVAPLHAGAVCDSDCSQHPSGLLLLCVAILIAASGALALQRGTRTWSAVAPRTGPPPRTSTRSTAPLRRLDLVADLCISRT